MSVGSKGWRGVGQGLRRASEDAGEGGRERERERVRQTDRQRQRDRDRKVNKRYY